MRSLLWTRAGRLVAGAGVLLAASLTGCWNTPQRADMRSPMGNMPRTNGNAGGPINGPSGVNVNPTGMNPTGMTTGHIAQPTNRVSGAPVGMSAPVGMTQGATGGAAGSPGYFNQVAPGSGNGIGQPIATSNNPGNGGIRPVANFGPATNEPLPPPDRLPVDSSSPRDLPPVQPITTQNMDNRTRYPKPSPPPIPIDNGASLPMPKKTADLPPLGPPG